MKKKPWMTVLRLAVLAMMTALVFVSNYLRVTIPINIGGNTSFTLANIMCCLSGLLLGPIGGLASGLGSMLFDFTDPRFISEFWITFLTKGAMGLGAGLVMLSAQKRSEAGYVRCLLGAILGCVIYYILYFTKSYYYNALLVEGLQSGSGAGYSGRQGARFPVQWHHRHRRRASPVSGHPAGSEAWPPILGINIKKDGR